MRAQEDSIKSVGLTLLYEPDWPIDPAVDVVLVHGIGGHPVRSWKYQSQAQTPTTPNSTVRTSSIRRKLKKAPPVSTLRRSNSEPLLVKEQGSLGRSRSLLRKGSAKSSSRLKLATSLAELAGQGAEADSDAYWPLSFLPASCPNARVFTWGYHTLVVDKKPLRLQGDIFAHAEELLVELASTRAVLGARPRPIIFVAHSTGGVLVKELLRQSEAERDGPLKEILLATSAVVFLGSPHRGTEHCNLGDAIKSMASVTLPIDPNDPVLSELCGADSIEVELGRQTFVRLWNDYNFRVKTFQESVIPSYSHPELRAETTIRRLASFIGDPRENAETIGALHDNICKFASAEDLGYRALVKSLAAFIAAEEDARHVLSTKETECLSALVQPQLILSETHPATSYPGTCLWLYDLHDFQAWHHRSGPSKYRILWIRGESGCGKTILLRSLRRRLERQWGPAGASFIWSTAGGYDATSVFFPGISRQQQEASPASVYRSLLSQLFLLDPRLRRALLKLYNYPRSDPRTFDDAQVVSFFADYYVNHRIETPARRTFIFVEIADDAGQAYVRELLGRLSQLARNSEFSICVASAYHPEIDDDKTISIPMHLRNTDDILRYVNLNLVAEWEERNRIVMCIGQKSGGVFLWAEIVVNILNAAIIEGATQEMIEYTLEEVPGDLHGLYEWMLSTLNEREKAESLILFQWVILAAQPMRLNDLFTAIRLTDPDPFASYQELGPFMALNIGKPFSMRDLRQLRNSEITSDTPDQFHRWLRARSIGLLELKSDNDDDNRQPVTNEPLGLQRVQPIHSSVRSFFLSGRGFACLASVNPPISASLSPTDFIDISHYALLRACLTYLNMRDFESLGPSKRRHHYHATDRSPQSPDSIKLDTWYHPPATVSSQRHLVMSSYPFLQYAVENLLFHLLSPTPFRYFLPQHEVLMAFSANNFRLWKRWTSLLGTRDAEVIIARHTTTTTTGGTGGVTSSPSSPSSLSSFSPSSAGGAGAGAKQVAALLSPVFGARFRLERVLRKLERLRVDSRMQLKSRPSPIGARLIPMLLLRYHARTLFSRPEKGCFSAQQLRRFSGLGLSADKLIATNKVAQALYDSNVWTWSRGGKKAKTDRYRVNVVGEELCDDILNYFGHTLNRHKGCDLIDIFPGVGTWSQKLHDVLEPRSHLLLEPEEEFYRPYLEPLLKRPGTKLLPESGIVWEELSSVLTPEHLPHQVERRYSTSETPERNDTLLVTINLSLYPKKKFRTFGSLVQLVLFQLISSIRPGSLLQRYGLVRMLIWVADDEKASLLPRSLQRRRKTVVETELSTEWVCEVAGADHVDETGTKPSSWFKRDMSIDMEQTRKVLRRMRKEKFITPPGRETLALKQVFELGKKRGAVAGKQAVRIARSYQGEKEKLESDFEAGLFDEHSAEHKRLKTLQYWANWNTKRGDYIHKLLQMRAKAIDLVKKGDSTGKAQKLMDDLAYEVNTLDKNLRLQYLLARDNLHSVQVDPPILSWDNRYAEPLVVKPTEFFPNVPCALLDIQPGAAAPILRDIGPRSTRAGDMFDLILRSLMSNSTHPISKALDLIYPGAGEGVYLNCPSLRDPHRGGSPMRGWDEPTPRGLTKEQFVDIITAWTEWPFHPTYAQLVSRTLDEAAEEEEAIMGNHATVE
ncbi:hypothetical protein MFIFM68171_07408 [Madurella fahalii]|uniref:Nephrocystin 3-like N-terminal domain-containing protein n=1 Tax=Madurella fahalii TaxID=1157608 RepID=A0ABQ0GHF7_9PEZI